MHVASTTSWTVLFFFNFQLFDLMARLTGKKIVNFLTVDWKKDLIVGGISQRQMSQRSEAVGFDRRFSLIYESNQCIAGSKKYKELIDLGVNGNYEKMQVAF